MDIHDNDDRRVPKKKKETAKERRWSRSLPLVGQKPPLWSAIPVGHYFVLIAGISASTSRCQWTDTLRVAGAVRRHVNTPCAEEMHAGDTAPGSIVANAERNALRLPVQSLFRRARRAGSEFAVRSWLRHGYVSPRRCTSLTLQRGSLTSSARGIGTGAAQAASHGRACVREWRRRLPASRVPQIGRATSAPLRRADRPGIAQRHQGKDSGAVLAIVLTLTPGYQDMSQTKMTSSGPTDEISAEKCTTVRYRTQRRGRNSVTRHASGQHLLQQPSLGSDLVTFGPSDFYPAL
ncbi:hypothetical protein EDB86DRAFT_2827620 [Lactarius hatsudake]|nr:hypothetical protein EDB86DRAFT_2827620 [Lactarius hatsudake]